LLPATGLSELIGDPSGRRMRGHLNHGSAAGHGP
jgi:hypothetical protein